MLMIFFIVIIFLVEALPLPPGEKCYWLSGSFDFLFAKALRRLLTPARFAPALCRKIHLWELVKNISWEGPELLSTQR
jgi:hypothetical protein